MHQPMMVVGSDMTCRDSMTAKIVQFLVYGYSRHFTRLIDGKNPCCEPKTTLYAVCCPFHYLAAIPYDFTLVCGLQPKRSSGKWEERREKTLAASLHGFMPFCIP
jgi:hypothetical protein